MQNPIAVALMTFAKYADAKLLEFANAVLLALKTNAWFPSLGTAYSDVATAHDDYAGKLSIAKTGTPSQKAEKNVAKKALVTALRTLCDAVNLAQRGNRAALLSSAFPLNKEIRVPVVLNPIRSMKITNGASGQLNIEVEKGAGTAGIMLQVCTDAEITDKSAWVSYPITESKFTLTDLTVGKYVYIRAAAIGTRKQTIYTDIVKKMVA